MLLTGPGWQGRPGARRRARLRRAAAAMLLGLATLVASRLVLAQLSPVTDPVLVAARDLAAGTRVEAGDVRTVQRARLPGAGAPEPVIGSAVGAVLAGPVRAGEEVTRSRLVGPDLLAGQPADSRAFWLPSASPDALVGIGAGAHVDVHAPGVSAPVLLDAVVLAVTGGAEDSAGLLGGGSSTAGVLLAAPRDDAARVLASGPEVGEAFRFALTGR